MARFEDHPLVRRARAREPAPRPTLSAGELVALTRDCGADDCGVVSLDAPLLAEDALHARQAFPKARSVISIVKRMHRGPVRSPSRSAANAEFHASSHDVEDVARAVVRRLEDMGIAALNPSTAFPMEMDRFPERGWILSQKLVAEAAGMGKRGIHRSVIHPRFGSFVLLGSVLTELDLDAPERTLDYNPCVECKLCVAACPVGAIKPDGYFDFSACFTHNYQQFMGGFVNFVEDIVEAKTAEDFERRSSFSETVTRWQSLTFGANYNSAYCLAVCPAGEDVIGRYIEDKPRHVTDHVVPLQAKVEPIYVVKGSDAEQHVVERFPHKQVRIVRSSARLTSVKTFLDMMYLGFQRGKAAGLDATYHFIFTGAESEEATVVIRRSALDVRRGLHGRPDLVVRADSRTWVRFLAGRAPIALALATRKIAIKGKPALLMAFGKCFPR